MVWFVSGLVLGAGGSSRLGQPKQLLPYRGTTLLGWVISQAEETPTLDEVTVVLGGAVEEVRAQLELRRAKVVVNPLFGEGCSSSYKAGLAALDPRAAALVILPGDQPSVSTEAIDRVIAEWQTSGAWIVVTSYQGQRGHPLLFSRELFPRLAELHGDKAAWKLTDHAEWVREVKVDQPLPKDVDTWQDYEAVLDG